MLLCDQIIFWSRHFDQPVYVGNLAAYVQFKAANPNREPSRILLPKKRRHKRYFR
jgi:hypothetical protein